MMMESNHPSSPSIATPQVVISTNESQNNNKMMDILENSSAETNFVSSPILFASDKLPEVAELTLQSTTSNTENITVNLPPYTKIEKIPNFDQIYEEMVKWKENIFLVPTGKAGKTFIKLITEWLNNFNIANTFQGIAMKVVMVLPNLLLQKPSATSKAKEHSKVLEDRLQCVCLQCGMMAISVVCYEIAK